MKKKKEPLTFSEDFDAKQKAVLQRKMKLSIKQKRGDSPVIKKSALPKKFLDPDW